MELCPLWWHLAFSGKINNISYYKEIGGPRPLAIFQCVFLFWKLFGNLWSSSRLELFYVADPIIDRTWRWINPAQAHVTPPTNTAPLFTVWQWHGASPRPDRVWPRSPAHTCPLSCAVVSSSPSASIYSTLPHHMCFCATLLYLSFTITTYIRGYIGLFVVVILVTLFC